ncbi:MAG: T9SS type A sorting domain-containing protein [Bacteroidia bacterium]
MRFLVYTLLLLVIPFAGFAQLKQAHAVLDSLSLATDTNKVLERNGNTPPPEVMVVSNDNCSSPQVLPTPTGFIAMVGPGLSSSGAGMAGTEPTPACFRTGTYLANSVWFTYSLAAAGSFSVSVISDVSAPPAVKAPQIAIYSYSNCPGSYSGTNLVGCGISPTTTSYSATASANCLQPGIYYILLESKSGGDYTITTAYSATPPSTSPSNDCCSGATPIPAASLNGTTIIPGTTVGATNDAETFAACNTLYNNVWYSFVAQGPNLEITVSGAAALTPQFVVLSGAASASVCTGAGTNTVVACNTSGTGTVTGTNITGTALVKDSTYYISVTSGAGGTFNLTINNPVPNPPYTNCANAMRLCANYTATNGNTNLWGYQDENITGGDCIGANGEIHSTWYAMYVNPLSPTSGSLTINITPTAATVDNYDFSIWKYTTDSICNHLPTNLISCNSSPTPGVTGLNTTSTTTYTNSGTIMNQQLTTNPGDIYVMLVNSTQIAGTYAITLGGNTLLDCTTPIILPIQLADFTATQNVNEVDLKWSTVTEKNNSYFTIERSADGKTFEELNKIKSIAENGNSTSTLYYTDVDYTPLAGTSYYRLSQTDFNGKTTKLGIAPVINKDNDGAFNIAPNPTNGMLNITYNCQTATTGIFKLYDSNGAVVLEQDVACALGNNKTQIDLSEKTNGIYFATFTTNTSFYRTKLIKK